VYEKPANLFVADFMGLVNKLPGNVAERNGEAIAVDVGGHRLNVVAHHAATGKSVTVAIRPEAFAFGEGTEGQTNRLSGVVTDAIFLGSIVDYQVDIGGVTLRVQGERRSFCPVGSDVVLTVPVGECVAMPNEGKEAGPQTPPPGQNAE
jgi:ABC-type Fe3+/spermidine/putrescine transport system ATPase subunit